MKHEEFDALVHRLEIVSQKHPRYYVVRLVGLVVLAYGYLFLILAGSLILALLMIGMVIKVPATAKLAFIGLIAFGGIFWAVLRGLWVRLEPPKGLELKRAEIPKLFTLLDELRGELNCRPFHKVILIDEMNAAVVQVPRLGIFGWHTNYLLLGLPLMQALAPDEFKAVLAHEFAHSSRGHGSFGNWLYRVRRTWERVFEQMAHQRTRFGGVLHKFINWFWPIFNAHAFVLARANEYEADACSVRLAGADAAAGALMRLPVANTLLGDKFWPSILSRANHEMEPPANVMLAMQDSLRAGLDPTEAQKRLRQSFLMETNNSDTHPCLTDRLRAIGRLPPASAEKEFNPLPPSSPAESAAEILLGLHATALAQHLSHDWKSSIAPQWSARYEHAQQLTGELAALEKTEAAANPEILWEKAKKIIQLHNDEKALPIVEQLLALTPNHVAANFVCGRHKLAQDDPAGVPLIEYAMDSDVELSEDGCNLLYGYFHRTGLQEKIPELRARMEKFQEVTALAGKERNDVKAMDTFIPHELNPMQIEGLRQIAAAEPDIKTVCVARKQVNYLKNSPCYVISLTVKTPWWKLRWSSANEKMIDRVLTKIKLSGYFLVFVNEKNLRSLGTKIAAVPGATVYERPKKH